METKNGRINKGFDPSPEKKKNQEIIYIPVKALNVLPDDKESSFSAVLLPPTPDTIVNIAPQVQPIVIQPSATQHTTTINTPVNNIDTPLDNIKPLDQSNGKIRPQTPTEGNGTKMNPQKQNKALLIILQIVSVFLIAFDVIQDWCQYQELLTIDERNNDTRWSLESFGDYFTFPSIDSIEESLKNVTNLYGYKHSFIPLRWWSFVLFGIPTVFGSAFACIRILNVIGEIIKDSKLKCFRGFQIIHGWTESLVAMVLEDSSQSSILFWYALSCKKYQLGYVKLIITMISGFMKNLSRLLSCRQQRHPGLNFDIGPPCFFLPWASNRYCHLCGGPKDTCSIQKQDCSIGFECPCFCSCGRLVMCGLSYEDGEEKRECCSYSCFSCFKDKNHDPMCTKTLLQFYLILQFSCIVTSIVFLDLHATTDDYYTIGSHEHNC